MELDTKFNFKLAINYSNLKKVVENLNEYRNIELMIVTKRPQEEIIELIEKGIAYLEKIEFKK